MYLSEERTMCVPIIEHYLFVLSLITRRCQALLLPLLLLFVPHSHLLTALRRSWPYVPLPLVTWLNSTPGGDTAGNLELWHRDIHPMTHAGKTHLPLWHFRMVQVCSTLKKKKLKLWHVWLYFILTCIMMAFFILIYFKVTCFFLWWQSWIFSSLQRRVILQN